MYSPFNAKAQILMYFVGYFWLALLVKAVYMWRHSPKCQKSIHQSIYPCISIILFIFIVPIYILLYPGIQCIYILVFILYAWINGPFRLKNKQYFFYLFSISRVYNIYLLIFFYSNFFVCFKKWLINLIDFGKIWN